MELGYQLVQYRDEFYSDGSPKMITRRIQQAMAKLEVALGYGAQTLDMAQGCHHDGSLSASTHLHADVMDLSYDSHDDKAKALMPLGVIPFVRPPGWGGPGTGAHIHCVLRGREFKPGTPGLDPQAYAQIADWDRHLNGLASHARYDSGPWGPVKDYAYDPDWTRDPKPPPPPPPPPRDPQFPDVSEAIGELGSLHATSWTIAQDLEVKAHAHPLIGPLADARDAVTAALPPIRDARTALVHWRNTQQGE